MGWFDEQIRERKRSDNSVISESLYDVIGAVSGKKIFYIPQDSRKAIKNEIDKILGFYRIKSRDLPDSVKNTEEQLEYLLRPCGIMRRTVILKGKWYKNAFGPLLARKKSDGSIVALIPSKSSVYMFTDAAKGKAVKVFSGNADEFEQEALCFYKPFPQGRLTGRELVRYIFETISKRDIAVFAIITFAVLAVSTLIPTLYNIIFARLIYQNSLRPLGAAAVFLICICISTGMLTAMKKLFEGKIRNKMKLCVEAATMMRVLSLPADFFKKTSSGALANKVMSVSELCTIIVDGVLTTGLTALFSLVFLVQIYIYTPSLWKWAMLSAAVTVIHAVFTAYRQTGVKREQIKQAENEQGLIYALITGIQKIKLVGAEKRAFSKWAKAFSAVAEIRYNPPILLKINNAISMAIAAASNIIIYYVAAKSNITVADFYTFSSAYGMLSGAFTLLGSTSLLIAGIKPVMESIQPIFDTPPEIAEDKQVISRISGGIELNGVSFRYNENMPNVIDNLTLKIRSGEYVAIVGTTGCGKSTLLRLMLGFEKPQRGAVYYDGKDLSKLDLKSLRQKIGAVMQDDKLFQGDIFSNISIGTPNLTFEKAWEAAEMAGIADDILNMPMGMNTVISEGSGGISGGQRQRILIARAIAAKPKILMFDEATSALDNITQRIVSKSLDKLKCTRIVIAHRLSTIKECNRIIFLDKGKIVEDGTFDELMEKKGLFAELVSRQKISGDL